MRNYYNMLNESFEKMLNEAQQVVIDFKNIFGAETYERFKAQKQRMQSPENDISYWVRRYRQEGDSVISEMDEFISNYENKLSRRERGEKASEGADLIYEDENWLVYHITTYEAAAKYGSHTRWCITGRYEGNEERGEYFFNSYLENNYSGYYFFIRKGNDEEKYAVCPFKNREGYDIWDPKDGRPRYVPNGPENVPGLPNLPVEEADWDYSLANEEPEEADDFDDFDDDEPEMEPEEPEAPAEWTDENGEIHRGQRPADPVEPEMIRVDNPNEFEFPARSREEAIAKFAEKGFEGAEFVEEIGGPLCIVHFMVEAKHEEFPMEDGDVYSRDIPGDRYTAFVYMPGEGGGPLMTQDGAVVAFRKIENCRAQFGADRFNADQIQRNNGAQEESLKEGLSSELDWKELPSWEDVHSFRNRANSKVHGHPVDWVVGSNTRDKDKKYFNQYSHNGEYTFVGAEDNGRFYLALKDKDGKIFNIIDDTNKPLKEGFFYFEKELAECDLKEECEDCGSCWAIFINNEEMPNWIGEELHFDSKEEAEKYAFDDLELLDGDFEVKHL